MAASPPVNPAVARTALVAASTSAMVPDGVPAPGAATATPAWSVSPSSDNAVVVCAFSTVWVRGEEMAAAELPSPDHAAVIEYVPVDRLDTDKVATPPAACTEPIATPESENSTVPPGAASC